MNLIRWIGSFERNRFLNNLLSEIGAIPSWFSPPISWKMWIRFCLPILAINTAKARYWCKESPCRRNRHPYKEESIKVDREIRNWVEYRGQVFGDFHPKLLEGKLSLRIAKEEDPELDLYRSGWFGRCVFSAIFRRKVDPNHDYKLCLKTYSIFRWNIDSVALHLYLLLGCYSIVPHMLSDRLFGKFPASEKVFHNAPNCDCTTYFCWSLYFWYFDALRRSWVCRSIAIVGA